MNMALSSEDDTTYLASPSKKKNVPVVAHVGNLIDIDPRSELIFETPPPDVVNSINKCFEQFTSTLEKKNDASVHQLSSDSDSGGSLFITQSVTKAVRTERRHRSSKRPESISDDSGNERDNGDTENERGSTSQHAECPFRRKIISHPAPRKAVFPFLLKSLGRQHLSLKKHQILENSEMGGFLKCIKKIEEGYVNTGRAISPSMPESDLSDLSEGDDHDSDHEVTKVDRTTFVPSYFKANKHKWLPQSFLEMRLQDSLSNDNEQQSVDTNRKAKQSKTKSTEKNKTSASVKKQSKKKNEASKNKAVVRTSSESSIDSLFKEQEKQHETQEVLAACSDAEHSDSAHCRQRLTKQIVQCTENLHGDHLVVIEETQRNSVELITETAVHIEHEDDTSTPSQADDIMWPENAVSGVQPSSQQKKKKKHKLKDQQEAEPGADAHSADNVHSVEMSQFNDSHTTELTPERTKKKREDRERTKTTHVEDDSGTDIQSNEAFEAPETKRPEHIQSSEEITSPVARLKSGKKNGSEESVDFALDVSSVSQFDNVADRSIQDTVEERQSDDVEHTEAELNEAEHSGSVQRADNLHEDDLAVTEERQRNSVEAVTEPAVEHESDVRSDNYLPNKSNSMSPPQGGDISTQNVNQQTDSDFGSEDLFRPLNSQKHKTNQIHKGASVKINMEDSDQDSDVTQIETEGPFESIFGQGTPRWCDAGIDACEDNDGDETQIENEGQSVSVLGTGTPNKQFTESQKTDQSPLGLNAELLSKRDEKVKSNNKKTKKTMSSSEKDSEDTDVEKTLIVQPSFKHLPPSDEVLSSSCVRNILGKRRARAEMETDLSESPLFRNGGLSFIKRKRNRKDKTGATASADVSSESPVDDITGDKITPRENRKSREVKNSVTNEEQTEASILHLEDTDLLEESISSTVADNSVITKVKKKKKKKYKSNENEDAEPSVENQSAETAKFNESQTTELISKVSKKKKRKDKERTKIAYADENNAADIPSSETLDSDRPAELRVNELNHFSEAPETDQPDHTETSEEITGCPLPTLKSVKKKKKKKKKRDETEEPEFVDLDVSSVSQIDYVTGLGVVEQQEDQVIEERPNDDNTTEHILKVAKRKKKSQNASSPSQSDDINGLEKQASGSQSESAEELLKKKKLKKHKLKERKNAEIALDIGDNVQLFQQSESQTTDLLSRKKTKKKRANKDTESTTVSSSNELSENMDDGHSEMRGNVIQSTEAIEADQLEHLQTSEEITRCPSPSVTKLSSGKKKKKKRDRSEKHQDESVDVDLDVSSVSQIDDVTELTERRPNTVEHVENVNSHVLSDSTFTSKKKKKKKHKLKDQQEAEPGADAHSADNVHSVEMDQFIELKTTEITPKKAKKKKKDKERTKTAHVEDDSGTDIQSNKTFAAPETEQPEHIQTSEEITGCPSPNVARLKSGKKKKKKKNGSEESVDFPPDVSLVSQETVEERPSDVEHIEAELNDTKHKKKRKRSSLSINNSSEFSSSDAKMQETVAPEKKRKKKRNSDHITNVGGELTSESSEHRMPQSQNAMLKSPETITKESRKKEKKNKEMNASHVLDDRAELETVQTKRTDSTQANVISLGDYEDVSKKKKKRKKDT